MRTERSTNAMRENLSSAVWVIAQLSLISGSRLLRKRGRYNSMSCSGLEKYLVWQRNIGFLSIIVLTRMKSPSDRQVHPFNLDQIPASAPSPFFLCCNTAPVWPVWETNGTITGDAPVLYICLGVWGFGSLGGTELSFSFRSRRAESSLTVSFSALSLFLIAIAWPPRCSGGIVWVIRRGLGPPSETSVLTWDSSTDAPSPHPHNYKTNMMN